MNLKFGTPTALWAVLTLPCVAPAARGGEVVERARSPVLFVADGTTLIVRLDGRPRRVRLEGVDEINSGTWDPKPRRLAATRFLRSLVADRDVALEFGPGDREAGRARVRREDDGLRVNREVVAQGFGVPSASDFEGKDEWLALAAEARSGRLGLWGEPPPAPEASSTEESRPVDRRESARRRHLRSIAARQCAAMDDQQFWYAFASMMATLPAPDV
jgi:endonuclease YncB( thermonuclease family)